MAKQAIEQIIYKVIGDEGRSVSKRQFITRNGLMHGRSISSIEKSTGMEISDLVNVLGYITWHAIFSSFEPKKDVQFQFGHRGGDFVNKYLTVSMLGSFAHQGDSPHPTEDKIPNVQISMLATPKQA